MRTFHAVMRRAVAASAFAASLVAVSLASPASAAAQEGVSADSAPPAERTGAADSSRGYDEPSSVWNAHRVVRVLGDGGHVVLGDGTIWEIYLPDRPSVNTWRRGDLLVVRERSLMQGDYDYSLIDGRTRGDVAARLVGAAPRRG